MEMRVEELSGRAGVSVDTIRYYQSKGLLDAPRREGRVAWYGEGHRARLERIRALQQRGFTLATIARLISGELDAADEALVAELTGVSDTASPGPPEARDLPPGGSGHAVLTLAELAEATGVPLAVLKAVEAEGLLIPRRIGTDERYTEDDVAAAQAGLLLLDWGIPLSALLDLARRHHQATEAVADEAVAMFSAYVREPLRTGRSPKAADATSSAAGEPGVDGLLQAYAELLPAVNTLVAHHFTRTLLKAALDHVERVGSPAERQAVHDRIGDAGANGSSDGAQDDLRGAPGDAETVRP